MAEAEIARHVEAAEQRWPLLGVTVIHRYGRLEPGEDIVLVVTAAAHRQDAFAAAEFLMDYLKTRAPFWKQVEYAGGGVGSMPSSPTTRSRIAGRVRAGARGGGMNRPLKRGRRVESAYPAPREHACNGWELVSGADSIGPSRAEMETNVMIRIRVRRCRAGVARPARGASGGDDVLSASVRRLSPRRRAGAGRHGLDQRPAPGICRPLRSEDRPARKDPLGPARRPTA